MDKRLVEPFIISTQNMLKEMTQLEVKFEKDPFEEAGDADSFGVASIINFAGKMRGRFIIDIELELSNKIVFNMLGENLGIKDRMYVATISEINNIISGDANTKLNNKFKLGLRLAPPIVFTGKEITISAPKINSYSVFGECEFGKIRINIGFQEELK
jgi:chemotaxis protein CheX